MLNIWTEYNLSILKQNSSNVKSENKCFALLFLPTSFFLHAVLLTLGLVKEWFSMVRGDLQLNVIELLLFKLAWEKFALWRVFIWSVGGWFSVSRGRRVGKLIALPARWNYAIQSCNNFRGRDEVVSKNGWGALKLSRLFACTWNTIMWNNSFKVLPVRTKRLFPDGVILGFQSYTVTFIDDELINHWIYGGILIMQCHSVKTGCFY